MTLLVHGPSKSGKTTLGDTAPAPRLYLDAEMRSQFTRSKKKLWDPNREKLPEYDGTWDTLTVYARDYTTVLKAYGWLNSGKHPFRSVVVDSISETQQRLIDSLVGSKQPTQQEWGNILRQVTFLIRQFRDLKTHPSRPMDAVVFVAMTQKKEDEVIWRPHVQGSLKTSLPYFFDVVGYLDVVKSADKAPVHRLFIGPVPGYETGDGTGGRLGAYVDNPNVTEMLARVRGCSVEDVLGTAKADTTKKETK